MGIRKWFGLREQEELDQIGTDARQSAEELEQVRRKQLAIMARVERLKREGQLYDDK